MLNTAAQAPPALNTSKLAQSGDDVQSPSLSTPSARARFEFENGKGNDGTKILMVEWDEEETAHNAESSWSVDWDGKPPVVLPVEDIVDGKLGVDDDSAPSTTDSDASSKHSRRQYFLLGPKVAIPATVTLTRSSTDKPSTPIIWKTNPLPAIFPSSFADPKTKQSKGVLHTVWAEKRMQKLEEEIEAEAKNNCEGIALQMAISEKEWIEDNFGLSPKVSDLPPLAIKPDVNRGPHQPSSPLSPGGSKLSEKLRGLKLQTNESEEQPNEQAATKTSVSSVPNAATKPTAAANVPSNSTAAASMGSIGAMLSGQVAPPEPADEEEDLFALPMSPRSPEMTVSPFSFAAEDTKRYIGVS